MTSQDCPHIEIHGINNLQKWNKIMNAKKQLATLSLIALGAFGTLKAQTSNDNLLAFNGAAKTEVVTKSEPVLKKGSGGEARRISNMNKALVVHVSANKNDKYTPEQYGLMLQSMFKDSKRTDFPTKISVLFEESEENLPTSFYAFINGHRFDKNGGVYVSGDGVLTTTEVVNLIPEITKQHAEKNNIAAVKKPKADSPSIVMN